MEDVSITVKPATAETSETGEPIDSKLGVELKEVVVEQVPDVPTITTKVVKSKVKMGHCGPYIPWWS